MYQFFVEENQIAGEQIFIEDNDVNHIKNVLRMKIGEQIRVCTRGGDGACYMCKIEAMTDDEVTAGVLYKEERTSELPAKVYLFQGLPKGDKMELIIQKAVELGVYEIIPVAMKNCVVKLDDKKAGKKIARWQGISESAAKQSKRMTIPKVHDVMNFGEALEYAQQMDLRLLPYENAAGMQATKDAMEQIKPGMSVAVFIGPEGGFDPKEIEKAEGNALIISLGSRILRTETAGLAVMSIIMYQLEIG